MKRYKNLWDNVVTLQIVEAGKKMKPSMHPFKTTIIINDKGFYEFT